MFIFFQRSQRNCEPEKRSLAGAWRRHLSWPTSLIRKFCQKSIFIWELISCSHRYLKICCHKYKDNISNLKLKLSHIHFMVFLSTVAWCYDNTVSVHHLDFFMRTTRHTAIKTRFQGSAEGTLALLILLFTAVKSSAVSLAVSFLPPSRKSSI